MRKGAGWRREHRQPPADGEKFLLTSLFIGHPRSKFRPQAMRQGRAAPPALLPVAGSDCADPLIEKTASNANNPQVQRGVMFRP